MYRFFSMVVILFALFGGGFAAYQLFDKTFAEQQVVDTEQAKGFASAFVRAYLTIENGEPASIEAYTDLPDPREIRVDTPADPANNVRKEINQRVIGLWPVKTELLAAKHMDVELIALVERQVPGQESYEQKKNGIIMYRIDVPVTQGEQGGYRILQYPRFSKLEKDPQASLPPLGTSDSPAATGMKPMLESFFRTYFEAKQPEDIANFFIDINQVPKPHQGLFSFEQLENLQAFSSGESTWFVLLNVKVRDNYTNVAYAFSYAMNVIKEGEKYYILSMEE